MTLLLLWSLALQIPYFAMRRARIDEIEKERVREVKG
jgi:hypothetical protein